MVVASQEGHVTCLEEEVEGAGWVEFEELASVAERLVALHELVEAKLEPMGQAELAVEGLLPPDRRQLEFPEHQ